jgi:hypothetical protein
MPEAFPSFVTSIQGHVCGFDVPGEIGAFGVDRGG